MKRTHLNFLVDAVAFAMFVFMVATGVIMEFLLPAGSGHATTIWSLDRHGWGDVHFLLSVVFLAALAVHVYLHWAWIVSVLRGRPREGSGVRVGLGFFAVAALLAIAAAPLFSPRESTEELVGSDGRRWELGAEAELVRGSMTLGEVAQATGVTVELLVSELGLPEDVPATERLGRLGRAYDFTLTQVRELVEAYH